MLKQIRINKTPLIEEALMVIRMQKFPLLEENEIVKFLISREYNDTIKEADGKRSYKEKQGIKKILKEIYAKGDKFGKAFLEKKGLKRKDLNEKQLYDLIENA